MIRLRVCWQWNKWHKPWRAAGPGSGLEAVVEVGKTTYINEKDFWDDFWDNYANNISSVCSFSLQQDVSFGNPDPQSHMQKNINLLSGPHIYVKCALLLKREEKIEVFTYTIQNESLIILIFYRGMLSWSDMSHFATFLVVMSVLFKCLLLCFATCRACFTLSFYLITIRLWMLRYVSSWDRLQSNSGLAP